MPVIEPISVEDCIEFIKKHRVEIEKGEYDLRIKDKEWVKSMELSDIDFLIQFCPSARWPIASSPFTPVELFKILARDKDFYVRTTVAANPNTPTDILDILAKDKEINVRESVAANPSIPINILKILSKECGEGEAISTYRVRSSVAGNPNTPADILEILAKDGEVSVRKAVAGNTGTPANILEILARDDWADDGYAVIKEAIAGNPSTPANVLKILLSKHNSDIVKERAYQNPNFSKCFIATAVYGTSYAQEIVVLKKFRDKKLITNHLCRLFLNYYYKFSPFIANYINKNVFLKNIIRIIIVAPLVKLIEKKHIE